MASAAAVEVVIFRCGEESPVDATSGLWTKRVVGLPGERIELVGGDVLVDGCVQTKSLAEQRVMRQLVCRGSDFDSSSQQQGNVLIPLFSRKQPITDDIVYNAGLSRELHWAHDFMLSAKTACQGDGWLRLGIDNGWLKMRVDICPVSGAIRLMQDDRQTVADSYRSGAAGSLSRAKCCWSCRRSIGNYCWPSTAASSGSTQSIPASGLY